jgi:hypothetical protein
MPNAPAEPSPADTALLDLFTPVERAVAPAPTAVLGTRAQRHSRRRALITKLALLPIWPVIALLVTVLLTLALWSSLLPGNGRGPAGQVGPSGQATHAPATPARPAGPPATTSQAGPADAAHATPTPPSSVTSPPPDRPARTASAPGAAARAATGAGPSATGDQRLQARRQGGKPPWAGSGRQKARDDHGRP